MAPNIQLATFVVSLIVIGLTANKFLSFHSYSKIFSGKPILQHYVEDEPSKHVENRQPLPKPSKRPEVLSKTSQVQSSTNKSLNVGRPLHKTRPGIYIEHKEQPKNVIFPVRPVLICCFLYMIKFKATFRQFSATI